MPYTRHYAVRKPSALRRKTNKKKMYVRRRPRISRGVPVSAVARTSSSYKAVKTSIYTRYETFKLDAGNLNSTDWFGSWMCDDTILKYPCFVDNLSAIQAGYESFRITNTKIFVSFSAQNSDGSVVSTPAGTVKGHTMTAWKEATRFSAICDFDNAFLLTPLQILNRNRVTSITANDRVLVADYKPQPINSAVGSQVNSNLKRSDWFNCAAQSSSVTYLGAQVAAQCFGGQAADNIIGPTVVITIQSTVQYKGANF